MSSAVLVRGVPSSLPSILEPAISSSGFQEVFGFSVQSNGNGENGEKQEESQETQEEDDDPLEGQDFEDDDLEVTVG